MIESSRLTPDMLRKRFQPCQDVTVKEYEWGPTRIPVMLVYAPAACDLKQLNEHILPELNEMARRKGHEGFNQLTGNWQRESVCEEDDIHVIEQKVFHGHLLLYAVQANKAYLVQIAKLPKRKPEEPSSEFSIRGARDGFIEDIETNIALIRIRYPDSNMHYETFQIGRRSRTKVGLLYMQDIINGDIVREVRRRLSAIDADAVTNAGQLEELLSARKFALFPLFDYTGRADYSVDSMLRGRFVLFLDGAPTAMIGPVNLLMLLKTSEDSEISFVFNSLERMLRVVGFFIALLLPGFWVALTSFHQDQLPFVLLASIAQSRAGVPLPVPLEAILMLILFELFREAGARLPVAVGQTLTVVGGLIIGDAAIRAGFTSPSLIVIIATSAVASFTLINQSLVGIVSVLRIAIVLASSFLGMFGFFVSLFCVIFYLAQLRSFGLPYLEPNYTFRPGKVILSMVRLPGKMLRKRPSFLNPGDRIRQGGDKHE